MRLQPGAVFPNERGIREPHRIGLRSGERAQTPMPEVQIGGNAVEQSYGRHRRGKLPADNQPARVVDSLDLNGSLVDARFTDRTRWRGRTSQARSVSPHVNEHGDRAA